MRVWHDIIDGKPLGGRATDLEQIALSVLAELSSIYPKEIPSHMKNRIIILAKKLQVAEIELKDFARMVLRERGQE